MNQLRSVMCVILYLDPNELEQGLIHESCWKEVKKNDASATV